MNIKNFVVLEGGANKRSICIVLGSVIFGVVMLCFLFLVGLVVFTCIKRKGKPKRIGSTGTSWTPLYTYRCSSIGTLSEGGFGMVYKGTLRDNTKVAV